MTITFRRNGWRPVSICGAANISFGFKGRPSLGVAFPSMIIGAEMAKAIGALMRSWVTMKTASPGVLITNSRAAKVIPVPVLPVARSLGEQISD